MRIIAGSAKGRTLKAPTWDGLRPTSDRLRETLFNILAPRIAGARVLDLFAGTGAIGLEALSRGAAEAVFVEQDRRAAALIAENAALAGLADRCVIIRGTVEHISERELGGPFNIAVLDPPYALAAVESALEWALQALAPGGLVVLEHASRRAPPALPLAQGLRTVRAGDSSLSFYQFRAAEPDHG
ncbi:MAG: 16S rRNA (guanine(966)-N(2))-methyltransferase RsmD [Acidobacteria bacterium]|nr:16S rRNA (guanine(966)-N(2))-methyltransferase RsmD [Acidobacteriota bacterium]